MPDTTLLDTDRINGSIGKDPVCGSEASFTVERYIPQAANADIMLDQINTKLQARYHVTK